jgi:hypothetical protein
MEIRLGFKKFNLTKEIPLHELSATVTSLQGPHGPFTKFGRCVLGPEGVYLFRTKHHRYLFVCEQPSSRGN